MQQNLSCEQFLRSVVSNHNVQQLKTLFFAIKTHKADFLGASGRKPCFAVIQHMCAVVKDPI